LSAHLTLHGFSCAVFEGVALIAQQNHYIGKTYLGRRELHQLSSPSCQDVLLASRAAVRAVVLTLSASAAFAITPLGLGVGQ